MKYSQAKKLRELLERFAAELTDEEALDGAEMLFPRWAPNVAYAYPVRVSYNGELYALIQGKDHTSQVDWTPDKTASLWNKVANPTEEYPEWVQPAGAHDAYEYGAKVSFYGKHYQSVYQGLNVWAPNVYGWEEID